MGCYILDLANTIERFFAGGIKLRYYEKFHRRENFSCWWDQNDYFFNQGLSKPNFPRPVCISGQLMKSRHSKPER
jgi:hypothetical protein